MMHKLVEAREVFSIFRMSDLKRDRELEGGRKNNSCPVFSSLHNSLHDPLKKIA